MKHSVEAATDAASLLLFDPRSLPEEFDTANSNGDPTEILSRLHDAGRLFWINTGSDGAYLLHVFIDEEPPADLRQYMHDRQTSEAFQVSGGAVFFTGAEYGYRDDDSALRRYPHMGSSFPAQNGIYGVALYRTEYPDGLHEHVFRQNVTPSEHRAHLIYNTLICVAALSVIAICIVFFYMPWGAWLVFALPASFTIFLPTIYKGLFPFRSAGIIWKLVNAQFPSIVATFHLKAR
jgi:hypothetical protein